MIKAKVLGLGPLQGCFLFVCLFCLFAMSSCVVLLKLPDPSIKKLIGSLAPLIPFDILQALVIFRWLNAL
jgi:hypothetical protein